jgi:hypothetical protein
MVSVKRCSLFFPLKKKNGASSNRVGKMNSGLKIFVKNDAVPVCDKNEKLGNFPIFQEIQVFCTFCTASVRKK